MIPTASVQATLLAPYPSSPLPFAYASSPPQVKPLNWIDTTKHARVSDAQSEPLIWDRQSRQMMPRHLYNQVRRQRRSYHRAMSGLTMRGQYRFVTLTHGPAAIEAGLDIRRSFRALIMRLRRRGLERGYYKVIEYTRAGQPHIHMLIRGRYIAQALLSRWWQQIHLSPIADIRAVSGKQGAARYLGKYLGKDVLARYSWSQNWVWSGFVQSWTDLLRLSLGHGRPFGETLSVWRQMLLDSHPLPRLRLGASSGGCRV